MNRTRRILSNFSVINIALAAVLIVLVNNILVPFLGKSAKITVPSPKKQTAATAKAPEKPVESKSPSPSDYFIIAEQNVFHPERKIPVEKKDVAAPLPKPDFALYGTLIIDDLRIAYMEDKKAPQNSPTRGKKQIPVRAGEALSGFILKEIDADKVVMARGDEKITVYLNDPSKSKSREVVSTAPAQAAPLGQPQTAQPPQRPGQPAVTTAQQANPQATPAPGIRQLFRRNRVSNYNAQ